MAGATTELEQMYCRVVSEGLGGGLPSPTDFKRNDPQVQALLLRRPAGRLGLEVPEPGAPAQADPSPEPSGAEPEPARSGPEGSPPQSGLLSDCQLEGQRIACPRQRYDLVSNQPNSQLAEGALAEDNRLGLRPFEGNRDDSEAVRRYLS